MQGNGQKLAKKPKHRPETNTENKKKQSQNKIYNIFYIIYGYTDVLCTAEDG